MSFKASIGGPERQLLWARTINVLASINETIKFTISSTELIAWTTNKTETTSCKVRFSRQFFDDFAFSPHEIIFGKEGVQVIADAQGLDHGLYSFGVNGSHLSAIARKTEGDTTKCFTIAINNTTTCPDFLANRLLIYIEMDSLIRKQHSLQISPMKYDPIIIDLRYKSKFLGVYGQSTDGEMLDPKLLENFRAAEGDIKKALFYDENKPTYRKGDQLTMADEINYVCCNQALLKNFIDNCNPNLTKELKLEISTSKLSLTAFSHAVHGKNNSILKNALSFTDTVSTLDLEHYCLFTTIDEESDYDNQKKTQVASKKEETKNIVFNLADFKKFMNIVSSWKNDNDNNVNIWFCHRGEPILLEMKRTDVTMELVQVTVANGMTVIESSSSGKSADRGKVKKVITPEKMKIQDSLKGEKGLARISPLKDKDYSTDTRAIPLVNTKFASPKGKIKRKLFVVDHSLGEDSIDSKKPKTWASQSTGSKDDALLNYKPEKLQEKDNATDPKAANAERHSTTVGWGPQTQNQHDNDSKLDIKSLLKREKLKYFQGLQVEEETFENKSQTEEEGLGPTPIAKPKGLFD